MSLSVSEKAKAVKPSSTLSITAKANALKAQGLDLVGFTAGEPDFETPAHIKEAAIRAIQENFTRYTTVAGIPELREAISVKFEQFNHLHYTAEQIVVSNGGKHSLKNIFTAILNPGDEVIIPAPYWLSYPEIVKLEGGVPVFLYSTPEKQYKVSAEQIKQAITPRTKAVILNSPNNPTGMVYSREELEAIAKVVVEADIYCISDEIYENLIYDGKAHVSMASLDPAIYARTITMSGLAKGYSMTGWRVGYTGSSLELARLMAGVQSHQTSNINSIAQKAAVAAFTGPQDTVDEMCRAFAARRDYIWERIQHIPHMQALKPEGAFYLFVNVGEVLNRMYKGQKVGDGATLAKILLEDFHVVVVPCADFGFADHIRLSYAISMEQIKKGMDRIAAFAETLTE